MNKEQVRGPRLASVGLTGLPVVRIAERLGVTAVRVSQLAKSIEGSDDPEMKRRVAALEKGLRQGS